MIEELKERFAFLKDDVLAILVFGSHARGEGAPSSDVDICIVAPESRPSEVLSKVYQNMDTKRLDVYCFSELPLHLKMDVIHHHKTLFVRDKPALYEHFYLYRKLWADEERRHRVTKEEILAML
ncbi:MAG: nucleotidyltransferase domain-containing protein [Methanobacteriota archaeon]|nr:MAG: nucleotidyltransferase domain-containing protein [Euryarchaeota archaeon]